MNGWTPQTGLMGDGWQYTYTATHIRGIKQTHQPSPWVNDYGQFSLMPTVGKEPVFDEEQRASWFGHKGEEASPHYYSVYLADYDVLAEVTPTERAAMFRLTYPRHLPEGEHSYLVVDAFDKGSSVVIDADRQRITGYSTRSNGSVPDNFRCYFVMEFDAPFVVATAYDGGVAVVAQSVQADHAGAVISFDTNRQRVVQVRVASSFISVDQAERNLNELGDGSFDALKDLGAQVWNEVLGRIEVEGEQDQLRTFYSCLYRSLLFPRKFYEYDEQGKVVHYSPYNGQVVSGYMYTDTGFWDTFRCLFPLLNLVYPSINREIQEGLVNAYRESGFYPEWASPGHHSCMIGNNSASVLADAYLKGVKVEDAHTMYQGLLHGANHAHPSIPSVGRLGCDYYNKMGYVPYDVNIKENGARTLEYAYADWCIWRMAVELGRPQEEIDLYAQRAMNYRSLYDPSTRLMRGRMANGEFMKPFSPLKWGDAFTEGNSWHYTWSVFHDPQGLIDLMGGRDVFVQMLDSVFSVPPHFDESYYGKVIHEIREMTIANMGNYAHGNQPVQHMIYLYNYAGAPWKTQYWAREVMDRLYSSAVDGYCGDEDNGQTSAWYVFSALGMYPVCPGTDQYVMGAPLFRRAVVTLENGRQIRIEAPDNSQEARYVKAVSLDGMRVNRTFLTHDELLVGPLLEYQMSTSPNFQRGIDVIDAPYSFSRDPLRK